MWILLGIISIILLAVYFGRVQNAVWGGFTGGIFVGSIILLISESNWSIVGKAAIVGTLVGFASELLGMLSDYLKYRV